MSYRTYINGKQLFGNNEYYPEWMAFIKSKGAVVDEEGCYAIDITDFMGALQTIETIVLRLVDEREERRKLYNKDGRTPFLSLFDLSEIVDDMKAEDTSLFDSICSAIEHSYALLPYHLYRLCQDVLEPDTVFSTDKHYYCFKVKEGEVLHIEAR